MSARSHCARRPDWLDRGSAELGRSGCSGVLRAVCAERERERVAGPGAVAIAETGAFRRYLWREIQCSGECFIVEAQWQVDDIADEDEVPRKAQLLRLRFFSNYLLSIPSIPSFRTLVTLPSPFLHSGCIAASPMLPRTLPGLLPRRLFSVSAKMASATPMEDLMRDKVRLHDIYTSTQHSS